jgi:hypothetical protein
MPPQRFIDQHLVAHRSARSTRLFKKMTHQILIQPDHDPRLAAWLRLHGQFCSLVQYIAFHEAMT